MKSRFERSFRYDMMEIQDTEREISPTLLLLATQGSVPMLHFFHPVLSAI